MCIRLIKSLRPWKTNLELENDWVVEEYRLPVWSMPVSLFYVFVEPGRT